MELSALSAYARDRYGIEEQHKWADFPGFSVLCHPGTGKWLALLMRGWDGERGEEIQCCDLKCGRDQLTRLNRPYLARPVRMQGGKWLGIFFDDRTEEDVVFSLFDLAYRSETPHGASIVLEPGPSRGKGLYQDTALPFAGTNDRPRRDRHPERLREMKRLYEYGPDTPSSRARNFIRQARFMEDYEDDLPWKGEYILYYPTYQDLTTRQLRGYFTWRTRLRKGRIDPIGPSAAYIYIYELLNGVGTSSPEDGFRKLREFEAGFADAGYGDKRMKANLRRWTLDYGVLHGLDPDLVREVLDPEILERDRAIGILRAPGDHTDEEVFSALGYFGGKKLETSLILSAAGPDKGRKLFADVWREAFGYQREDKDLFALCFGKPLTSLWYPLSNAIWYEETKPGDRDYVLDGARTYSVRGGTWHVTVYEKLLFDRALFQGLIHETESRLRRYLKTGRYLKEKPENAWAIPYIDKVIEEDRLAEIEAKRPKITIDLSGLDQIRRDALVTRDSLLTEEDLREAEEPGAAAAVPVPVSPGPARNGAGEGEAGAEAGWAPERPEERPEAGEADQAEESILDGLERQVLEALLEGRDPSGIIRGHHSMASLLADSINEALYEEFGDTVLLCEGESMLLVDDYIEDLKDYLKGTES